ncbi:peptidoglycan editing factor PgeF [Vibrio sp. SS-MA-C1-2]|uniref:peptidoglycan editing factor PgeF n=1 Tax=Vibrio sp. SS-MA-C1-2 TaxID=2908646 RepID=UPI001F338B4A|nr:peptidoglycan editing factor PgeF [Vibrio sp. SS-MA-C1-2]UJF18936.1 peptidoglycan editing factor PgeF [Vibrio sp. SS-MA-C1-2]
MKWITPNWPAPSNVNALMTTRQDGVSLAPFHSFNLGAHVGDNLEHVTENREQLINLATLPTPPRWLNQTHSTTVINLDLPTDTDLPNGDASFTKQKNVVSTIMTADCLPLLICNKQGTQVAAVHAGWRGLVDGVIEETIATFDVEPSELMVWLGAAIGSEAFEVGNDVRDAFITSDPKAAAGFTMKASTESLSQENSISKMLKHEDDLIDSANQKWFSDIYFLAELRLNHLGIHDIYGGEFCTYKQKDSFFSYRRDGQTGRMASLIWLTK